MNIKKYLFANHGKFVDGTVAYEIELSSNVKIYVKYEYASDNLQVGVSVDNELVKELEYADFIDVLDAMLEYTTEEGSEVIPDPSLLVLRQNGDIVFTKGES